ncbi:uncharacterized protein LOC129594621 [Paramacrobiotus metropolitanus]|uniref:uncharacterized protein LOC129594621 n=1 Tax=Paramacrobiotus metropolitanus TaxID=2943436 RepID=UPI002445AADA|nr:uncharacterized protein LOC129594621 [Paramacrobiotus metropolitanus]
MLRILCAVAFLCGAVYSQLTMPGLTGLNFGENCATEDRLAFFQCSAEIQMQNMTKAQVFQQTVQIFQTGMFTEEQAKEIADAFCSLANASSACLRAARCGSGPVIIPPSQLDENVLQMCSSPNRYKHFTEIARCNKRLFIDFAFVSDPQLANIHVIMSNITMTSTSNDTPSLLPQRFLTIICRLFNRLRELVPSERVTATCGADAQTAFTELTGHIRKTFQCQSR